MPEPDSSALSRRTYNPFTTVSLNEGPVGTFVDEHEPVLRHFDAGMKTRYQPALHNQIIFVTAPECDAGPRILCQHDLVVAPIQVKFTGHLAARDHEIDRQFHAGRFVRLPEHLEDRNFISLAAHRRKVDLTNQPATGRLADRRWPPS